MDSLTGLRILLFISVFSLQAQDALQPKNPSTPEKIAPQAPKDTTPRKEDLVDAKKEAKIDKEEKKILVPKKQSLLFQGGDSELRFGIKLRLPEFFYGKNLRLLNDDNPTDRVLYFRHTIDFNAEYRYGRPQTNYDLAFVKMTVRNKGVWGDPESIALTTNQSIKELDAVFGDHKHGIPRHILWIRELWIQLSLNDILCMPFCNLHTITFGAFPFELGRGIALGSAYATDASDLGFFNEAAIDQYAFGGKITGELVKDKLYYDIYGAILDNKANSFDYTNTKIRGQQYGFRQDQARGFGIINYVVAARLKWNPSFNNPKALVRVEPYGLYNHAPEQKIEFVGDATSDLCTIGLAAEGEFQDFECGFDTAFNFGRQKVYGWDRNIIRLENLNGSAVVVNTRVRQAAQNPNPTSSPLALRVSANQTIINQSAQSATANGQIIGQNNLGVLINDIDRFSDPYTNKYRGYMFVYDMGYYICRPDLKVCAGFGYASGDTNPNKGEEFRGDSDVDGVYEGFIGLQEVYSGTRIKSAFLLAGQARIPRPLTFPSEEVFDPFAVNVSRFTNIMYVGTSAYWKPTWSCRKWSFNPNLLAYWTDNATPFFDSKTLQNSTSRFARNFIGVEVNAFIEAELFTDLRFFTVASIFFPGSFYRDIKGRPLTRAQQSFLDNEDRTGILNDRVPLLGDNKSYFINSGLTYSF